MEAAFALRALLRCGDDEAAVNGSILVADAIHNIRAIGLSIGVKEPPLPEVPQGTDGDAYDIMLATAHGQPPADEA